MRVLSAADTGEWEIITSYGSLFLADFKTNPKHLTHIYGDNVIEYSVLNILCCEVGTGGKFVVAQRDDLGGTKVFLLTTAPVSLIIPKF